MSLTNKGSLLLILLASTSTYASPVRGEKSNRCLDVHGASQVSGTRVELYDCAGSPNQDFTFQDMGGGQFEMIAQHSGKCVDGTGTDNGAKVQQWDCWGGPNQLWTIQDMGSGFSEIKSVNGGRCLDVYDTANGSGLYLWDCWGGTNQLWSIGAAAPTPAPTVTPAPTATAAATVTWTHCANENGQCNFNGTQTVRYGANGKYVSGNYTNGVSCSNSVFGDPIYGTVKSCDVSGTPSSQPSPQPSPQPTASPPATSTGDSSGVQARMAIAFADGFGVNTHLTWGGPYGNVANVQKALAYMGTKHVRDSIPYSLSTWQTLNSALGVKFDCLASTPNINPSGDLSLMDQLAKSNPGSIEAYEGPNEFNNNDYTYNGQNSRGNGAWGRMMDDASFKALHADSNLSGAQYIGVTMSNATSAEISALGNVSSSVDAVAWHTYFNNGQEAQGNVSYGYSQAESQAQGKPMFFTEIGCSAYDGSHGKCRTE